LPAPRWQVDLIFPRPRVTYQASEKARYHIGLEPGGDEWNVELPEGSRDLALEEYRAGGGAEWRLTRHVGLLAQAGAVFGARAGGARGAGQAVRLRHRRHLVRADRIALPLTFA
jgi:hypothetical protein